MLRPVILPEETTTGHLYLCSMPGRFEPLEVFLKEIAEAGVTNVVCLVSDEEIAEKSPDYLAALQRNDIPATIWRFDIPDYRMPENTHDLVLMIDRLMERLAQGESVVIHCAAGVGRTGTVATHLLTRMEMTLDDALKTIRQAGSEPETQEQLDFLRKHARA